jgi:hypothetical protein
MIIAETVYRYCSIQVYATICVHCSELQLAAQGRCVCCSEL